MGWLKKKEEEPKQRDEILILPNGCRLNLTLYGRVISAKILEGDFNVSYSHFLTSLTSEEYRKGIEKVLKKEIKKQ